MNLRSLIQLSRTLPVELTETHLSSITLFFFFFFFWERSSVTLLFNGLHFILNTLRVGGKGNENIIRYWSNYKTLDNLHLFMTINYISILQQYVMYVLYCLRPTMIKFNEILFISKYQLNNNYGELLEKDTKRACIEAFGLWYQAHNNLFVKMGAID